MTRLYFIRHADAYDADGIQLNNYSLNEFGKVQASQLTRRLKENKFDAMYCSKIKRSMETCAIVNERFKMDVEYDAALNEVGEADWPQPGFVSEPRALQNFKAAAKTIRDFYYKLIKEHKGQEVIIFTHGNWIRVLLADLLGSCTPETFAHFVIHNSSLNIIDVDDNEFAHIISVSDAAHTYLYNAENSL